MSIDTLGLIGIGLCVLLSIGAVIYPSIAGNKSLLDVNHEFTKAITYIGDERIELDIKSWKDYEGEQIQIKAADGKVYLVSSLNTILIGE